MEDWQFRAFRKWEVWLLVVLGLMVIVGLIFIVPASPPL